MERDALAQTAWTVPAYSALFTGREDILVQIHEHFHSSSGKSTLPLALSGAGGVGKTRLAIEYALRQRRVHPYILWVDADTHESLVASYERIAQTLNLPEKHEQKQIRLIHAVLDWLNLPRERTDILLIFDNANDLTLLHPFLPSGGHVHVLLTTQAQDMGTLARHIQIGMMTEYEGTELLLRRAALLAEDATVQEASQTDYAEARMIVQELGGLPLALDQAGAYIKETRCTLATYLKQYRKKHIRLLHRRGNAIDHTQSVVTTFSLAFEKIERSSPAAADLLRVCAYLAPDHIPEEILTTGGEHVGPHLALLLQDAEDVSEVLSLIERHSLIQREVKEKRFSVHRLVQAVLLQLPTRSFAAAR